MPRCDEHGHYESRCPDCAQAFGHDDCEDTIAELRADIERLTRELAEARAALYAHASQCEVPGRECQRRAVVVGGPSLARAFCDVHAPPGAQPLTHAPAIRAAEGGE